MKKILLLPGWMESLQLYEDHKDFHVCIGKLDDACSSTDCVVGLSLGALIALKNIKYIKGKIILINPPIPRRTIFTWFVRWLNYVLHEGLFLERQSFTKNPIRYSRELIHCIQLLRTDFSDVFDNPQLKETLVVIRGKSDNYFCDEKAVNFLRSKNITIIEVDGGHNWNQEVEKALISNY